MPAGSSSEAPVMRPGPIPDQKPRLEFARDGG
jgi:hypothetical protein